MIFLREVSCVLGKIISLQMVSSQEKVVAQENCLLRKLVVLLGGEKLSLLCRWFSSQESLLSEKVFVLEIHRPGKFITLVEVGEGRMLRKIFVGQYGPYDPYGGSAGL